MLSEKNVVYVIDYLLKSGIIASLASLIILLIKYGQKVIEAKLNELHRKKDMEVYNVLDREINDVIYLLRDEVNSLKNLSSGNLDTTDIEYIRIKAMGMVSDNLLKIGITGVDPEYIKDKISARYEHLKQKSM